jgi:hypothetical protein
MHNRDHRHHQTFVQRTAYQHRREHARLNQAIRIFHIHTGSDRARVGFNRIRDENQSSFDRLISQCWNLGFRHAARSDQPCLLLGNFCNQPDMRQVSHGKQRISGLHDLSLRDLALDHHPVYRRYDG